MLSSIRAWARAFCALVVAALAACSAERSSPATDTEATASPRAVEVDDFGSPIVDGPAPARIVSLNPTTTELLFTLGVGDRVVGRTRWDLYPEAARAVPDLGDGIRPNVEAILAARPELVLLYASADNRPAADALTRAGVRVVALKIDRIEQFLRAARTIGRIAGARSAGEAVADSVARTLDRVRAVTAGVRRPRVLWPLLADPIYVIGGGSFMSQLVEVAGGVNVFGDATQPSPQVSREELLRRGADVVIASPRSAERMRTDPAWRALAAVREGRVLVGDTALVERPSVRLGEAAVSIARMLHPDLRDRLSFTTPR